MYSWNIATPEEFGDVCALYRASGLYSGDFYDIERRISTPLLLKHLITFRNQADKICGFVTFAYLSDEAERHMPTTGITAQDWKSGDNFWTIDFVVSPGANGYRMMRQIIRSLGIKKTRLYREKHREIREMRAL